MNTFQDDIEQRIGYVIMDNKVIAGYIYIDFSGEPAYEKIEGTWKTDKPYAVVHRWAFSEKYRNGIEQHNTFFN